MGTVYTNEVTLTVTAAGPTIDTQPQNTTVDENTTATFTIGATGTGTLSYQWKKDGVPVGTNSTTYAFTAVEGDTGAVITCEVTDDVGTTVSDNATLTVTALFPTITVQPQTQTVDELDDVTFTVEATASAGTLSYQWYRNGGPVGTSTNSYTYQALLVNDADTVYCDVSDSNGTTTSTTATLTVTDLVLTIDTQPQSIDEVPALTPVSFSITYTSSYPASVQWYKDGEAVVGEIADTYSFTLQDTDEGSEIYATVTSAVDEQTTNTATIGFVLAPVTDLTYTVVKSDYRKPISKRGYVVLNRPLEEGESLSIERVTNVDNDLPAVEGEAFVSEGWEYQLDRYTLRLQEIEAHACDCSEEDTFPEGPPVVGPPPTEGCEPYDCSAFENYVLTQSDADFYGIFSNNKPDATSYLYNYNTVTAQNFSLESSIGATTQYDTPVDRIAVCYDGAFYRQTNEHNYPVVPKSWTKDTYLSAGMVIISNAGNTGVKRMMGIKHGQNSGRFVVDYNYGTGDWTVDFSTGTDTMYAPISNGVPVLLYAAYDELTGDYFLRVNDTTQAGTVGVGAGSNFGTGTVDFTNAGDVTNNLDSTLIVAWIKEDDVDISDLMYTEFLRSVEGYTVPANCGLDGSIGEPALVLDGQLSNRTYCYNSLVDFDNDTIVYVPHRNTTFEYSTDSGATWTTSNVAAADLLFGSNNNTEWGNFVYTGGEWIVFVWQPNTRAWGVWNFGPDLSNAAPTFITRDGDSMGFTRGMSQGNDGVIRTNSRSYVDGTRWGYVYTTSGSTATQTTPVTGSSTDWWTSKMDFKGTTIATGPGAGGGGGISLEVGSYYNNSFEAETNDTSMVVTTNSTTAAFIPAPAEGGNNQLVSFYKFTTTDGTHTIQSFACGEQMVQARMIWAYGRFVMIARPYNQGDHLLYSTSLDGTTWTDIAEIALPNFCSQNPGATPAFQIAEWNANRILIHYKNSTGFFSLISVTMSTAVEVGTPITYVPEWETQECNEFSCDSTANWLSTYTDGLATGANLLTGATAVGSTIAVAGELWPVGGTFATPTTPGVFADQCGTEYGVPADGGYLDMLAVSQPGTDRYTRGVIVNGLTTTYTPIFECTYTHSVPAGVICDGRWICTEGDYNFTMTVELKRKGDHFMQRVTVFSPDIPADDFSNTVFEREHTWVVGGPISLQVQYDFDSYSNASGSFAGPKVTLGIGDGFNSAAFVNGLLDTSRGSITINSMDLLKGSSGLQFSHAFRLDKLDEVDHTSTINTIGLALAVQQNDSGWVLPDYCPTP